MQISRIFPMALMNKESLEVAGVRWWLEIDGVAVTGGISRWKTAFHQATKGPLTIAFLSLFLSFAPVPL